MELCDRVGREGGPEATLYLTLAIVPTWRALTPRVLGGRQLVQRSGRPSMLRSCLFVICLGVIPSADMMLTNGRVAPSQNWVPQLGSIPRGPIQGAHTT